MGRTNAALLGGTALTALGMGLLVPILPAYASALGAGPALVGPLLAGFGLTRLVVALPAVWLAGRVGRRRLLAGSPTVIAPVAALCAVSLGFWPLALFCLVEGGAAAVYATTGAAAATDEPEPQSRGRSLAAYQTATLLGASLGPALGGVVGQQFGLRAPFLVYAVLAALAAWWLRRRLPPDAARPPADRGATRHGQPRAVWRLLLGPGLPALWLLGFTVAFVRVGMQLIIAPLLGAQLLGLSPRAIGGALSLGGFATLAAFYPAGWVADRYGRKAAILPGGAGMVAALALFATAGSYGSFVAATMLLGGASGLIGPAPAAYLADALPAEGRPVGVSVYRMLGDAGTTVAPPVLGWLVARTGYDSALLTAGLLLLAAVGAFVWRAPVTPTEPAAAPSPLSDPTDA